MSRTHSLFYQLVCVSTFQDIPFEIDDDVEVVPTPGMCPMAVAVVASNTQVGTVAIAGKRQKGLKMSRSDDLNVNFLLELTYPHIH